MDQLADLFFGSHDSANPCPSRVFISLCLPASALVLMNQALPDFGSNSICYFSAFERRVCLSLLGVSNVGVCTYWTTLLVPFRNASSLKHNWSIWRKIYTILTQVWALWGRWGTPLYGLRLAWCFSILFMLWLFNYENRSTVLFWMDQWWASSLSVLLLETELSAPRLLLCWETTAPQLSLIRGLVLTDNIYWYTVKVLCSLTVLDSRLQYVQQGIPSGQTTSGNVAFKYKDQARQQVFDASLWLRALPSISFTFIWP